MSPLLTLGLAIARNMAVRRPPGYKLPTRPADYRIPVVEESCRARIGGILSAFFTGFEAGLRRPRNEGREAENIAELYHPFFHEGRAMGLAARASLAGGGVEEASRKAINGEEDPFTFLKCVGIGFWLGFRHARSGPRVEVIARRFGKYGDLVLDGYGFKVGFFDALPETRASRRLSVSMRAAEGLSLTGKAAFWNGLGRALWFFSMDDPGRAFASARGFGEEAAQVLGGLGLAAAFTFPDDLARAYFPLDSLPEGEHGQFLKGIRIALYVRDVNHPLFLERCLAALPEPLRERARTDLEIARRVGRETRPRPDFIAAFHRGCGEAAA